jgi:hypothetical protein
MEFTIGQNSSLPLLKLQVVKDGIENYNSMMEFIERSTIFFSMVDTANGIPKVYSKSAGFVEKLEMDPNASPEYYVYYRFTTQDTSRIGRYEGQFLFINDTGTLVLPIREKLYINIVESYVKIDSITNNVEDSNIDINFKVSSKSIYNNSIEANKVLINDETSLPIDFFSDCTKYIYQDSKFLLRPHLEFIIDNQYILKQLIDEVVVPLNKTIPIEVHYIDPDNINFKFDYIKLKDKAEFLEVPSQLEMINKKMESANMNKRLASEQ